MANHRITPDQKAAAVAAFQEVLQSSLAGDLAAISSGVPVSHQHSLASAAPRALADGAPAYLAGFWTPLQSAALPGALPTGFNQPARSPYGLYNEQINGTSFVAPRAINFRSWFYRLRPSVASMTPFKPIAADEAPLFVGDFSPAAGLCAPTPEPLRFKGIPVPLRRAPSGDASQGQEPVSAKKLTFVSGLATLGGCGSPITRSGWAVHWYRINADMTDESFYNSDGDMLVVPEKGTLTIQTEFGFLEVSPGEFFVLPQGLKMTVTLKAGTSFARGWVSEIFQGHFSLPNRGPLGSNGMLAMLVVTYDISAHR